MLVAVVVAVVGVEETLAALHTDPSQLSHACTHKRVTKAE